MNTPNWSTADAWQFLFHLPFSAILGLLLFVVLANLNFGIFMWTMGRWGRP